jgi:hypothetical protein
MKRVLRTIWLASLAFSLPALSLAAEGPKAKGNGITGMSKEAMITLSLSAAPPEISRDATVMIPGEDGKLVEVKKGTNGFTCIPTVNNRPEPDPMCMDQAVGQWVNDLMSNAPKPTNTVPGIGYMAKGGWHFEKDGKILMNEEPGSKAVKEPAHWMVMWPFDSKASGLPSVETPMGAYVMFDGTPYAHLMVYQDPMKIKTGK